ncbi:MAG: steroid Delta-isomerase [Solimonas sp.]
MRSEKTMKEAMQAYIDGFNRADAQAIAALYADDATVEDPVGSKIKQGKAEITKFYEFSISTGAKLKLAAPIRGSHGNSAAMAFDVELKMPDGQAVIRVIDVMTFDEAGKFSSMRAYWAPGDMEVLGSK